MEGEQILRTIDYDRFYGFHWLVLVVFMNAIADLSIQS